MKHVDAFFCQKINAFLRLMDYNPKKKSYFLDYNPKNYIFAVLNNRYL